MKKWKTIAVSDLPDNPFELIGKEWMLITAGNSGHFNTMTASWGGLGILWHKPVATVYIRSTRYTDQFVKRYDGFTLSVLPEEFREALNVCGTLSGRDVNKVEMAGLTACVMPDSRVAFEEARLVFSCRKIYSDKIKPEQFIDKTISKHYPKLDYHNIYVGEITSAFVER